jgi:hypothetical protein
LIIRPKHVVEIDGFNPCINAFWDFAAFHRVYRNFNDQLTDAERILNIRGLDYTLLQQLQFLLFSENIVLD